MGYTVIQSHLGFIRSGISVKSWIPDLVCGKITREALKPSRFQLSQQNPLHKHLNGVWKTIRIQEDPQKIHGLSSFPPSKTGDVWSPWRRRWWSMGLVRSIAAALSRSRRKKWDEGRGCEAEKTMGTFVFFGTLFNRQPNITS